MKTQLFRISVKLCIERETYVDKFENWPLFQSSYFFRWILKENWRQKITFFYLHFRSYTIIFSTFFLAWYPSFMREFIPILGHQHCTAFCSFWRMVWGRHARVPLILEAVFLSDVCREYWVREETAKQRRKFSQQHLFLLIKKFLFPMSYITSGCWFSFGVRTEKAETVGKTQLPT